MLSQDDEAVLSTVWGHADNALNWVLGEGLEDYRLVKNPLTFACLKLSLSSINLTCWILKSDTILSILNIRSEEIECTCLKGSQSQNTNVDHYLEL